MTLLHGIEDLHEARGDTKDRAQDPFTDPATLALAVKSGLLDAPHLQGNPSACGKIVTSMVGGACVAVDPVTRAPVDEETRVNAALTKSGNRYTFPIASITGVLTPDR
jgi:hypothetical protein